MARGKRTCTPEELLIKITNDIATKEEELIQLKEQKAQLEAEIKEKQLLELDYLISQSGKTIEEVIVLLKTEITDEALTA